MYQAHHQSKLHRQQLQHSEQPQHRPQQLPAQAYPPGQQQHQAQGFGVLRTVSTPAWLPSTNQTFHASASSAIGTAGPPAPSSSSSSGSLLSYWDRSAASDSELRMATTLPPSGPYHHHHAMSDMGYHRHALSAAFLPSVSPSGIVAHPSSASHMGSSGRTHSYGSAGSEHYHPYRPSSMPSVGSSMSVQQHGSPSSLQQASSSGPSYPSSVSAPLTSPGFVYGPSGSSAPLGPGTSYDTYPQSFQGAHSQHVFYLPPAMPHDSRFYPLNPFEIKHRRRTTKAQSRLLESTFREVPKPNATLRKQTSTQLDMPVRAVQIWFQNRRAKAKATDKKRQSDGGRGGADSQDRPSMGSGFEGQGRRTSRSMDLPPLRIQADQSRPDVYCSSSSTSTLPSRTTETGQTRDRRGFATPPISAGADSWSQQALGLSYSTLNFDSQEQAEHSYSMRSGAAHGMPAPAPLGQSHASASDPSAGMPSGLDRPSRPTSLSSYSGRESSMLSGSSPRPIGHDSSCYWSAPQ
ncbi:uncharacterized protein UBRO_03270 [Ustilago bromivora]|uniref:Homeobox domain-containing protein n=2 Tax=Ustilago bromivora TaxID=307758 RepID=A0A1K0H5Q7_9BASI|nr:uncharacterized protein UBRO_03270 [Ustilago bromivora]